MTNRQLLQLKRRYMAEGYKMAKKKMLKEYYTEDGEHYFEREEAKEFEKKLALINRIFQECVSFSRRKEYIDADGAYDELIEEMELALKFLKDN